MEQMARAVLISLVVNTVAALELWLPGHEVVYQYNTSMVASTVFPEHMVSQWNMSGKLVVQGGEDLATVQLQDLKVLTYTGPRSHDTPIVATPLPEQASQLLQPFIIHYYEGQVVGLSVKAGEEEWSINMKRGLVSLLQLDLLRLQSSAFISTESSQYGHCSVQYSVQRPSNGTVAVQKFVDFPSCVDFPVQKLSNVQKMSCSSGAPTATMSSGSMRAYVLEPSGPGGHLLIHSVQADGVIHLQHPNSYFLQSWVGLYLVWQHEVEVPRAMKGGGERVQLVHQVPGADVSQGRSPTSQQDLLTMVTEILGELADSLEWWHLETNLDRLHEEHVVHALYLLSLLEQASLHNLFLELDVGTSYRHETLRNLFLELLPFVGSRDSMLLVRNLVMRGAVKNDTAIRLLSSLPFNVHQPSEQLLTDLEVLLLIPEDTLEHSAALLSFATLVHKVCSSRCMPETVDRYVSQYLDLLTGSKDYAHQMLYLTALTNFELQQVVQLLTPLIRGDDGRYPRHTRVLAMWATMACSTLQPDQVYHLYWPLLTNCSEDLEVRVVALTMLVLGQPSVTHLYNLMLFMQHERNAHLRHFWYTTLHSLAHSQHPCHMHMREVAKKLVQFVVDPEVGHWTGGNYVLDYADPDNGFSSQANLIMVSSPRTGLPTVFNLDIGSHTMGYTYNQFSVFIRLEGLGDVIKQQLMQARSFSVTQLVTMLQQLKIPTKPSEPVHVELLVKMQSKVVLVHHANESTLNTLFKVLNSVQLLANGGIHLNAQKIFVPFLVKEMRVTDLGTNALLQMSAGGLVSVRASFSTSPVLSSGLELLSSLSYQMSLSQYNPVLNMWHGVQQSLNMHVNTAFNLQASFSATQEHVRFTVQHTPAKEMGLVTHVHTTVFVKGAAAATKLKSHCATCPVHVSVTRNVSYPPLQNLLHLEMSGLRLELALLDCEHSLSEDDLLELIYRGSPARSPLLKLLQLFKYLMLLPVLPNIGSCGLLVRVLPAGTQPIKVEAIFQGQRTEQLEPLPAGEYRAQLCMVQSLVNSTSSSWDLCILYVHLPALSKHSITMELTTHGGHKMCLNLTTSFLELSDSVDSLINPRPHSTTAVLSVAWGPPTDGEQCPLETSLQVALEGRVTTEQWSLVSSATAWPYDACRQDIQNTQQRGRHLIPLTRACHEVAHKLASQRYYNISITSINLPTWSDALQNFLPSKLASVLSRNVSVQLLVPPEGRPVLTVNSHTMMLGSAVGTQLQPWLINTQFPPLLRLVSRLGITGSCALTEHSVRTLDGVTLTTNVPTCYTVAMADCSSQPRFAVFVKMVESSASPLAVKVYTNDNYVEVLPTADQLSISVNGQIMRHPEEGYQYSNTVFRVWHHPDGLVRIHVGEGDIWLEYYGHFITVSVLGLYRGGLCGLCGDHDGDPSNDAGKMFTLPCPGRR